MRAVTFRAVLQAEFERRQSTNPRYSLRSFARDLALDHSTLSQFLRGRRRLTGRIVRALGRRLRLPATDVAELCALENESAVLSVLGRGFRTRDIQAAGMTLVGTVEMGDLIAAEVEKSY